MTTDPIEQLMKSVRSIHLSDDERSAMRRTLLSFAAAHPARGPVGAFFTRHMMSAAFAMLVLLMGSTTALADRALPGDFLYTVKTSVNDRVVVAVAGTDEEKIEKELDLISQALEQEDQAADETELEVPVESLEEEIAPVNFNDGAESDLRGIGAEIDASLSATPEPLD